MTKRIMRHDAEEKGRECPRCKSTNTDKQNNIWYCYDCEKEF